MRRFLLSTVISATLLVAPSALPCGMPFGQDTFFSADQFIVVKHKDNIETYVFRPHFCGRASEFGMILPVPAALHDNPSLALATLYDELKEYSKPLVEDKTVCQSNHGGTGGAGSAPPDAGSGVTVINKGQVGFLEWSLLQADTQAAFTDWLTANQYPFANDAATNASFGSYVSKGWYFVAFKISANASAPPPGSQLCGDLGPISLSFPADVPVIPARITGAGTSYHYGWSVYTISDKLFDGTQTGVKCTEKFGGTFTVDDPTTFPQISTLATSGDRIGKLILDFWGGQLDDDLNLLPAAGQSDFRDTEYNYNVIDCGEAGAGTGGSTPSLPASDASAEGGGCSMSRAGLSWVPTVVGLAALALAAFTRRRSRSRPRTQ